MKEQNRAARKCAIERAAFELLEENGFAGTSMLSIAKRAKASNETLYRWYGDKQGLYRSLIEANAEKVRKTLKQGINGDQPLETLDTFGRELLAMLTSDEAIALNRAAAADVTNTLGQDLAKLGRGSVVPLLQEIFETARAQGRIAYNDVDEAVSLYLGLLIGDLQVRRITGTVAAPSKDQIKRQASRALSAITRLLDPRQ